MSFISNYVDGITNISLIDGVMRMDLITLSRGSPEKPKAVISGHLCMSTRAFLRAYQQMTDVLMDLEKQGLIKKREKRTDGENPAPEKTAVKAKSAAKK